MKLIIFFAAALLIGIASGAPAVSSETKDNDKVIVDAEFFLDEYKFYESQHDIVKISVPLNNLNFDEDEEDDSDDSTAVIFFVEADIKDGKKEYKGLYVHDRKTAKLVLANGRDVASRPDDSKTAFFAAADGIYTYDAETQSAKKYGTFDKSIFAIDVINGSDTIYAITDDKELYKITNKGQDSQKIDAVKNAEDIVVDLKDNIFIYTTGEAPQVFDGTTVKTIAGLPPNPTYVALLKPPFAVETGIPAVVNDKTYMLYANGTSELSDFEIKAYPTAYSMEATIIQYYAHDKKIYEYNFLAMLLGQMLEGLKDYIEGKKAEIENLATKSRSSFHS